MNKYSINKLPKDISKEVADKCRVIRKQNGFSQAELAERSGVSLGSVKRFEQSGKIAFVSFLKLLLVLGRLSEMESILNAKDDLTRIEKLFSSKTKS